MQIREAGQLTGCRAGQLNFRLRGGREGGREGRRVGSGEMIQLETVRNSRVMFSEELSQI